jgi:hypothetical protein
MYSANIRYRKRLIGHVRERGKSFAETRTKSSRPALKIATLEKGRLSAMTDRYSSPNFGIIPALDPTSWSDNYPDGLSPQRCHY